MKNKENLRKCIGCNQITNRDEMIKITKESSTGQIFINPNSKIFGRSVYLCYNNSCIKDSLKKNRLARLLRTAITEELKTELETFHKE